MWSKFKRLFFIKTHWEVYIITYALALGACERGKQYLDLYPGYGGWLLFAACNGAVLMAGALMLDATRKVRAQPNDRRQLDRRSKDRRLTARKAAVRQPAMP
jgi:hypothetical protein